MILHTLQCRHRLPKKLDEEVARLHLEKIGVKPTKAPGYDHASQRGQSNREKSLDGLPKRLRHVPTG